MTGPAADSASALDLTLDADGSGGEEAMTATVECAGPGAAPEGRTCELVESLSPADLDPVPPDMACTQIYGGPDTLEVTGTLEGEPVDAVLTRENGCEIARFDAWAPLLRELFPGYRPGASLSPG